MRRKAFFLALIFIGGVLVFALLDDFLTRAVAPLWRSQTKVSRSLSDVGSFFRTQTSLRAENAALKEKLSSLELELSALSLSQAETERLLGLLNRRSEPQGIAVAVLTRPPQSPYDLVVVDAGAREGVTVGARVYLPEGPEVGTVAEVFESFSRVKLLSTAGQRSPAVLERFEVPVELEGRGGGNFKIVLPRETQVEVGDRILSGSLNAHLVAVVESVHMEPTDSFKEVLARSPANIFSVRFLTVRP